MKNAKLILTFAMMLTSLTTQANSFLEERETYARGIMVATDTRDQADCQRTRDQIRTFMPLEEDLCAVDELNPISVVVMTIPIDEWDFMGEVDSSRRAERSARDSNVGFVRGGRTSLLFLLPSARESNNMIRVAVRRDAATVAQVRVSDLSMLQEIKRGHTFVHFILRNIPRHLSDEDREASDRIIRRVRLRSSSIEGMAKEKSILQSLNIVDNINTSINDPASPDRFEMGFFLPEGLCLSLKKCLNSEDDDSFFPLSLGFSFKIRF
ncbi:hypothetical protein [Bdellovibrio bacteriovorus]|uniref:hypothetical protein n=1 Tax=Bdellovibrio bacteriovorus TaxID=959 RepID=UPI0035A58075